MAMTDDDVQSFLQGPRIASLLTLRPDGAPTSAPLWFAWDGQKVQLFTPRESGKVTRILSDPRVALTVAAGTGEPPAWVTIEGIAAVYDGGIELARRLAPLYYDEATAAAAVERWEKDPESLVLLEIEPRRIAHW